ncbi:MAG: DUF2490 domain-containing protein [Bacteroidota bacterium]
MGSRKWHTVLMTGLAVVVFGQSSGPVVGSQFKEPESRWWFNTYGNVRLGDRLFWIAQTHFRFEESASRPFVGRIAQVYNRHALSYALDGHFDVSLGGVLRLNYNSAREASENEVNVVPEWRIWHEYLWAQGFFNGKVYHRLRIEHRWTRGFSESTDWLFRNRWRYMIAMKHPLNRKQLEVGAVYIGPEAEVIMQSGKAVVGSPLEDLRLHLSFGYIISPNVTLATGLMYSFGQQLDDGSLFNQKYTIRTHLYFTPDWRKIKSKIPAINLRE